MIRKRRPEAIYETAYTDAPSSTWHVYRRTAPSWGFDDIGYVQPRRHLWEDDKDWHAWTVRGELVAGPFDAKDAAVEALIASDREMQAARRAGA